MVFAPTTLWIHGGRVVGNPEVGNKQAPGKFECSSALSFPAKRYEQTSVQNARNRSYIDPAKSEKSSQ